MSQNHYDVLVVGGGISGAALFYTIAEYTDLKKVALVEKYEKLAPLNSNGAGNSQTLHCGDIETNYTAEKAKKVKVTANMVTEYCRLKGHLEPADNKAAADKQIMFKCTKMAMGVGEEEIAYMRKRLEDFKPIFPYMRAMEQDELEKLEPNLVFLKDGSKRPEPVFAMGAEGQYSAVNFGELTNSFVENAQKIKDKTADVFLNTRVMKMKKEGDKFVIKTNNPNNPEFTANFVVVNAGAHSLLLAKNMGYGRDLSTLPVAGSFYYADLSILKSKVYMVQNPKLPFAALHGDPDILVPGKMRMGPTALALPKLERYKPGTYWEFARSFAPDGAVASAMWKLFGDSEIRNYILRNFFFEIPGIGTSLFLKDARKIIPSLTTADITYAHNVGGVRPQVINKKTRKLELGEAKIETGEGITFNMTPSPGATSCLGNARADVEILAKYLGCKYDEERLKADLVRE